jgi:hypothetical protein
MFFFSDLAARAIHEKRVAILSSIGVLFLAIFCGVFISRKPPSENQQSPTALVQAAATGHAQPGFGSGSFDSNTQLRPSHQPLPMKATNVLFPNR